jgi:transposase-like protein
MRQNTLADMCPNTYPEADIDDGRRARLSADDRAELLALRHELRTTKMENKILKRAAAYFAKDHVLPTRPTPSSPAAARTRPWQPAVWW